MKDGDAGCGGVGKSTCAKNPRVQRMLGRRGKGPSKRQIECSA